jgi:hypothetical protein
MRLTGVPPLTSGQPIDCMQLMHSRMWPEARPA